MANDKLVNREVLKEVREKFQQKIENATIVAGQARTIAAVSEESGTMQDAAFINQGTGTANNTELVDTSPIGKNIQKEGYSIVYNQLAKPFNATNWGDWSYESNKSFSDGVVTFSPRGGTYGDLTQVVNIPANHKVLFIGKARFTTNVGTLSFYERGTANVSQSIQNLSTAFSTFYFELQNTVDTTRLQIITNEEVQIKDFVTINLTQWFNGKIPSDLLSYPSHFSWYYNGDLSYNVGQIKDCNGRYLECGQGRNVWDEQWEAGTFDTTTGENTSGTGIRSKNLIRVIPNTDYYGWCGSGGGFWVMFLDKDENVIPLTDSIGTVTNNVVSIREDIIKTPANAIYAKFYISSEYGSTYKHDITISLYYESGDSYYGHYYPYVPPVTYDTGNNVLRSIPVVDGDDIKDIELPSNAITRPVGTYTFTGNETWVFDSTNNRWNMSFSGHKADCKNMCSNGIKAVFTTYYFRVTISDNPQLTSSSNMNSIFANGVVLYYELATPTTETGTAFIDNIQINDYSYMLWKDTNEDDVVIPQGVKIFYPADYVLDMDTLHTYTDGDMAKIVLKGELSSGDPDTLKGSVDLTNSLYAIMQQNIGGTLRHQLADKASVNFDNTAFVDLGTLSWTRNAEKDAFYATISDAVDYTTNCICTKYPTVQMSVIWTAAQDDCCSMQNNYIGASYYKRIVIRDTSYTDATAFKAAMKGILLAYEKA